MPTICSRKPGAKRSIWAMIASVASPVYPCGDVGIRPQRIDAAGRPGRVGQVLLADEHERPLGHRPRWHGALVGEHLVGIAAEMHGAGLTRRLARPRDVAVDREVDLERARTVSETAVRAGNSAR